VRALAASLSPERGPEAARAIMTTDTRPKEVRVDLTLGGVQATVAGMAKGAGMIAPNMATLLAFFTTDASVEAPLLRRALHEAVDATLNRVTVDGDTSTNDMALVMASGAAGSRPVAEGTDYAAFREALTEAARQLAMMIVRDGEGVTRTAEVRVEGAASPYVADRVARTVAESPLVKTALHGGDPNWGRILAAVGRAGVHVEIDRVDIFLGEVWVAERGAARGYSEDDAHRAVTQDAVRIRIVLHQGTAAGSIWTSDFSKDYVAINAHYRS
jgi:glutamate N-acetyltransferase/amino-acid N-acetyltransferase